jgi:dTDP-4-amino-4,6-dideoxy-D-galactose acyltransferase
MKPEVSSGVETGCRILEWDSEFFGRRIARIEPSALVIGGPLAVAAWCSAEQVECLYLLVDVDDQAACDCAQANGFRLVDLRVTLESAPRLPADERCAGGPVIRVARPDDVDALRSIARDSHHETRFYVDGHFDRRRCDELYELWIARSCDGWADRVFVVDADGAAAGYLTCHLRDGMGQIGLVAVGAASRGRGSGSALVDAARRWFAGQGVNRISVATQARNAMALRMYQRAGMRVTSIQLWFHKWL